MDGEKAGPSTIDEYIAQFPYEVQDILSKIRAVAKEAAPGAVEKMSYNMPALYLNGFLVSYAAWKRHIGFYPWNAEMEASIEGSSAFKGTKGSVHSPLDKPMPYDLIRELVKFRVAENLKELHPER